MDLQKFCCKDPLKKEALAQPFTQDGITWATNGWMVIGVPALPEISENPNAPLISKVKPGQAPGQWYSVPVVDVHTCRHCNGAVTGFDCYECNGHGTVTLKNEYHEYSGIECESCDATGEVLLCKYCSGTGVDSEVMVEIGPAVFKANALHTIKDLPGIQIAPTGPTTPAYLRFDGGGVGFLMPGKDNRGK